jgi:hypothetical protein
MEQMKEELVAVIGRYFDIDQTQIQLNVERQEGRLVIETLIPTNGRHHLYYLDLSSMLRPPRRSLRSHGSHRERIA